MYLLKRVDLFLLNEENKLGSGKSIYEKSVTRLLSALESNQFTNGGSNVARLEKIYC